MGWERIRKKLESIEEVLNEKITTVDYAISAAWFLKRSVFDEVGLLDEKIFYAPEDAEFCARLWRKGYEVWYYPKVTIIHDAQRITKKNLFQNWEYFIFLVYCVFGLSITGF